MLFLAKTPFEARLTKPLTPDRRPCGSALGEQLAALARDSYVRQSWVVALDQNMFLCCCMWDLHQCKACVQKWVCVSSSLGGSVKGGEHIFKHT